MSKEQEKLGKGLEALIPKSFLSQGKTITQLPLAEIEVNPNQPRHYFDAQKLESLTNSIKQFGLNQPILVRKISNGYQLIAGERRFRACMAAELSTVPAIIKNVSDKQSLELALIENLEREDLNVVEEAKGYQRLIQEFNFTHSDLTRLSKGKNRSTITNTLRLLKLPAEVQAAIVDEKITAGHARALLSFEDEERLMAVFHIILKQHLSVREVEALTAEANTIKKKKKPKVSSFATQLIKQFEGNQHVGVKVSGTPKKGKIEFRYGSEDELKKLLGRLGI